MVYENSSYDIFTTPSLVKLRQRHVNIKKKEKRKKEGENNNSQRCVLAYWTCLEKCNKNNK